MIEKFCIKVAANRGGLFYQSQPAANPRPLDSRQPDADKVIKSAGKFFGWIKISNRRKVKGMNGHFFLENFRNIVVLLVALAWNNFSFAGEIHDAAAKGDLEKVKSLLKDNPNLVFSSETNDTPLLNGGMPLHFAVYNDQEAVAELLISNKADVNATNSGGATPLDLAAWKGYKDVTELLLTKGANLNGGDNNVGMALQLAVCGNHKD